MKESILHYVWQYKLFPQHGLKTTGGESVEIIDTGRYNQDAGPDFFNAKIKINHTLWAGNVEIHSVSSDWNRHQHSTNKAYDSVILHVVERADTEVYRTDGNRIPQLVLPIAPDILENYELLQKGSGAVRCAEKIPFVPAVFIENWKNALLAERLGVKTDAIKSLLDDTDNDWDEVFYIILARSFGAGINAEPFERLAKSLPLSVLDKHADNVFQLEALLFGQAGLLPDHPFDDYATCLCKEYAFLQTKYGLKKSLDAEQWKFSRLRPANFPTIRIAEFAALIHTSGRLFSKVLEQTEAGAFYDMLQGEVSEYWKTHYTFSGSETAKRTKKLGKQAIDTILINTVVSFVFCYGTLRRNESLKARALAWLEELPAERNVIVSDWESVGLVCKSAYDSQALIQLRKCYCNEKKCLHCRIGHKVLSVPPAGKTLP